MAYLVSKVLLTLLIVGNVAALQHNECELPTDNFGDYKQQ